MGDNVGVAALTVELQEVDKALSSAIDKAIEFWKQFNTPEARTAINGLMNLKDGIKIGEQKLERTKFEQPIDQLQSQRSGLMEQIQFYKDLGQNNVVETLRDQLRQTDIELLKGIEDGLAYWRAHDGPEAQAAILNLENLRNQIQAAQQEFSVSAGQIQQAFAGSLTDSVKQFAQELVDTGNPLRALAVASLNFAASFLEKIADMILQMAALKLAMKLGFGKQSNQINGLLNAAPLLVAAPLLSKSGTELTAGGTTLIGAAGLWMATAGQIQAAAAALAASGGGGGSGAGGVGGLIAGLFHSGGVAGSSNRPRAVSPGWFQSAVRYHSGGLAGLAPDEVPAILQRGEEILTKTDARHRANGGAAGGGGRPKSKTEVLAIGDKEIASAMAGASGDEVMIRWLRRNKETVRQMLDE